MAFESPPTFLQSGSYGAEQTRRAIGMLLQRGSTIGSVTGGIVGTNDCQITAGGGMTVNVAAGEVVVPGSSSSTQSGYGCRVSSTSNLSIAASNPSLPRIDLVQASVTDSAYSGVTNTFAVNVLTGTATSGATLTNLSGAPSLSASSLLLGYVLVPAASSSVTNGNISNRAGLVASNIAALGYQNVTSSATATQNCMHIVTNPGAATTLTLPAAPVTATLVGVYNNSSSGGTISIVPGTSGTIWGLGLSGASSMSLNTFASVAWLYGSGSVWFVVVGQQDTGWVALSLTSNWGTTAGFYTPSYRVIGDRVWLKGAATNSTGGNSATPFNTFPAATRPASSIVVPMPSNSGSITNLQINSAGTYTAPLTPNTDNIYLDGLSWSLS